MNTSKKLVIVLLLFCSVSGFATSFTFGESIEVNNERELIDTIMQNEKYCVKKIADGRIYLKHKKLFPSDEGIFLRIDHFFLVRLPTVMSDENGPFLPLL